MMEYRCVVCHEPVGRDIVVCEQCARRLGTPRQRTEEAIQKFKIERRERSK